MGHYRGLVRDDKAHGLSLATEGEARLEQAAFELSLSLVSFELRNIVYVDACFHTQRRTIDVLRRCRQRGVEHCPR